MKQLFHSVIAFFFFCNLSAQTEKLDAMYSTVDRLFKESKEDSAFLMFNDFLNRKDISVFEKFYCELTYAQLLTERENIDKGMAMIRSAKSQILQTNNNNLKDTLVAMANNQIGNTYFTLQKFDSAEYYCLMAQPYLSKTSYEDLSFNYEILGYTSFLNHDYKGSIDNYENAIIFKNKLPGIHKHIATYCKIALAKYKLGNKVEAFNLLERCKQISDSTKNIGHNIVTYNTLLDIYVEEEDFKKAYDTKLVIDEYVKKRAEQNQKRKYDELDIKYQTKFKEQENEGLKILNKEKEISLSSQRKALIIVSITVLILLILLYVVIRLFNQKKKINLDLEQKKQELERLHLLNQKIFAVVSHDFKEPLLNLEMLLRADSRKALTSEDSEKQKIQISNQLRQSNLVIENLISWAKNELNVKSINQSDSNPYDVVEGVLVQFVASLQAKKVKVENKIPAIQNIKIPADILKIIFRNLISNAIKYSYKQGLITVGYRAEDNTYFVSDTGTGIPPGKLEELFVRHVDSDLGTNHESGHGIGLNLVHELVVKYNGKIWIESQEGEYTIVFFKFKA